MASTEVYSRIGQASAAFRSLEWCLWKQHNLMVKAKIHIFRTFILPVVLYGSEMWTVLKADQNKLERFKCGACGMYCTSLCDRFRNDTIRMRRENKPTVKEVIQKRRQQWFGHVQYAIPTGGNGLRNGRSDYWRPRTPGQNRSRLTSKTKGLAFVMPNMKL